MKRDTLLDSFMGTAALMLSFGSAVLVANCYYHVADECTDTRCDDCYMKSRGTCELQSSASTVKHCQHDKAADWLGPPVAVGVKWMLIDITELGGCGNEYHYVVNNQPLQVQCEWSIAEGVCKCQTPGGGQFMLTGNQCDLRFGVNACP